MRAEEPVAKNIYTRRDIMRCKYDNGNYDECGPSSHCTHCWYNYLVPRAGNSYSITEWDGTEDTVQLIEVSEDMVTMRYPDGVTHRVAKDYFISLT